ncbi:50S ribosomal protein L24 [Candidatus Woesebacteria bacterium]|nr:50S ribosomal protein L24 [Candidatus Woesebacteria bacterium]
MLKFKKGDKIQVTQGKDRGRKGTIEAVLTKKNAVLVQGLNMYKKHVKGYQGQKGGVYDVPRPLAFSKVALICPNCKKITRIGFEKAGEEKVRICRKCNREIKKVKEK